VASSCSMFWLLEAVVWSLEIRVVVWEDWLFVAMVGCFGRSSQPRR